MSARVLTLCTDPALLVDFLEALPSDVAVCRAPLVRPTALAATLNRFDGDAVVVILPLALPWIDDMWPILAAASTTVLSLVADSERVQKTAPIGRELGWAELPALAEELSSRRPLREAASAERVPDWMRLWPSGNLSARDILARSVGLLAMSQGCLAGGILLDGEGDIVHLELRHRDAAGQAIAETLWSREEWRSNRQGNGLLYAATAGVTLFAPDLGAAFWARLALPDEDQRLLNELAINGAAAVPFKTGAGQRGALAVLTVGADPTVTPETQSVLEGVVAHTLRLLDVADERATLLSRFSAVERLADRNDQLARLAADLSGEQSRLGAAAGLMTTLVRAHQPRRTALWELDEEQGRLRMLTAFDGEVADDKGDATWESVSLDVPSGLADAIRARTTTYHADPAELLEAYPNLRGRVDPAQKAWVSVPMVSGEKVLGVLALAFDEPQSFEPDDLAHLEALARLGAIHFERITLYERLQDALTRARAAQARQRVLAEAGRILATPLDPNEIATEFTRLCVPALAAGCTVSQIDEEGALRLLAVSHVDPARRAAFLEARTSSYPGGAIPRDHPLLDFMEIHDTWSYLSAEFLSSVYESQPEMPGTYRQLGFHSASFHSMKARGRTVGLLVLGRADPQEPFLPEEETLFRDLAARLALALDSARLVQGLAAADRSKDVYLATLAHELRNPIGAIGLAAEMLEGAHPEDTSVHIVKRQVSHLSRLLQDLLDLSRITRGKISLQVADVAIHPLVVDAVTRHPVARARDRQIIVDAQDEGLLVRADPVRLTQIVTNLLDNAVKFSPEDTPIEITLRGEADHVLLALRDHGRGLTCEEQTQIFQPFAQFAADKEGLGLGLAIVHQLCALHGASITVESGGLGAGACFTLRLDRRHGEGSEVPERPTEITGDHQALRILLVEDHEDARELLTFLLEGWGHTVRSAPTGETALAIAKAERLDMALVDIGLPDMTGIDLATLLRGEWGSGPKLIAISGYGQPEEIARARSAGFDKYLLKPVDVPELRRCLTVPGDEEPG